MVQESFNPLQPNISIHILHTPLCTFPLVLTRIICLKMKPIWLAIISFILVVLVNDSAVL